MIKDSYPTLPPRLAITAGSRAVAGRLLAHEQAARKMLTLDWAVRIRLLVLASDAAHFGGGMKIIKIARRLLNPHVLSD